VLGKAFVLILVENCCDAIQEFKNKKENDDTEEGQKRGTYAQGKYKNHGIKKEDRGW
jgi:hypothetical protein